MIIDYVDQFARARALPVRLPLALVSGVLPGITSSAPAAWRVPVRRDSLFVMSLFIVACAAGSYQSTAGSVTTSCTGKDHQHPSDVDHNVISCSLYHRHLLFNRRLLVVRKFSRHRYCTPRYCCNCRLCRVRIGRDKQCLQHNFQHCLRKYVRRRLFQLATLQTTVLSISQRILFD